MEICALIQQYLNARYLLREPYSGIGARGCSLAYPRSRLLAETLHMDKRMAGTQDAHLRTPDPNPGNLCSWMFAWMRVRARSFAVKTPHMGEKEGEKEAKTKMLRCVRRADFSRRTCLGDGEEKVCREIFT